MRSSMRAAARPGQRDASFVGDSRGGLQHAARISSIIEHAAGRLLRPALVWPCALGSLLCACSVVPRAPASRRCIAVPGLSSVICARCVRLGWLRSVAWAMFLGAPACARDLLPRFAWPFEEGGAARFHHAGLRRRLGAAFHVEQKSSTRNTRACSTWNKRLSGQAVPSDCNDEKKDH